MFKLTSGLMRSAFSAIKSRRLLATPRFFFANNGRSVVPPPQHKAPLLEQVENEIKY